jgi:plasmanylethanolamine desaturase
VKVFVKKRSSVMNALSYVPWGTMAAVVLADLVSGVVHWAEDAYVRFKPNRRLALLNQIAHDNQLHHRRPREFLARSWWASSWDLVLAAGLFLAVTWGLGTLNFSVLVFALLVMNANQLHKWTHRNPRENPVVVTWLQRLRILQTPRHHGLHHKGHKNSHYCVVTNFLNPVLERMKFWNILEWSIAKIFDVKRQADV